MTPAEKAESLFRLARSTTSSAERASALARAREIVAKHRLLVTSEGRVIERAATPPSPPPKAPPPRPPSPAASLSAWWDDVAPRAKRFLDAVVASSEAERERATKTAAARRVRRSWDLRDVVDEPPRRRH